MSKLLPKTPLTIRVVFLYVIIGLIGCLIYWTIAILSATTVIIIPPKNQRNYNTGPIVEKVIVDGNPISFKLDRLNINLAVQNGYYDAKSDSWTLSNGTVYFAVMTRLPNNQDGSSFMYGHNQDDTLAKLSDLVIGDRLDIATQNGYIFEYAYSDDEYVVPSYVEILNYKPTSPRLIVSMCEGIFSQTRRIMYFDFIGVRKI